LPDAGGTVIEATELTDLARRAGVDASELTNTVAAFNRSIQSGGPFAPARTTDVYPAHPVAKPPFYAIPLCAGITVTSGGLSVNGKGQVMDADDRPVPGLYAAGATVGGIEGGPAASYVGGLIKSFAIGLIAADTIASARGEPN
jgi:fumarate reductase flavoprotein subunit